MQTFKLNGAFLLEEICYYAAVEQRVRPFIIIGQGWASLFSPFNYSSTQIHFKVVLNLNLFLNFHACIFSSYADKTAKNLPTLLSVVSSVHTELVKQRYAHVRIYRT